MTNSVLEAYFQSLINPANRIDRAVLVSKILTVTMTRSVVLFAFIAIFALGQDKRQDSNSHQEKNAPQNLPSSSSSPPSASPLDRILEGNNQPPSEDLTKVRIMGHDVAPRFEFKDGKVCAIIYDGRISLRADSGTQAYADHAVYDQERAMAILTGNVSAYQGGIIYRGNTATYFYDEERLDTSQLRASIDPIILEAGQFQTITKEGKQLLIGDHAGITTHDVEHPDYWIRADRTTVIPGEKVIFRNFRLESKKRDLFWLPYLGQPLDADLGFLFIPGGDSNLGSYLKTRYGIMLGGEQDALTGEINDAWLLSQWRADLYTLRGIGLGVDLFDTRIEEKNQFRSLKLYYVQDFNSNLERAGIRRKNVPNERFRAELNYRKPLWEAPETTYGLDTNLTVLSDQFFLEDFDPDLFRKDSAPDNYLALVRRSEQSMATFSIRPRLNSFYQSNTHLPEFTFDWTRQPVKETNLLYESQTSFGFYEEHLDLKTRSDLKAEAAKLPIQHPRAQEIERFLSDRGFARFHTYHETSLPLKIGQFNITPSIGTGHSSYGSIQGPADSEQRNSIFAGVDFSTKLTKDYPAIEDSKWRLNEIKHIIQPYATLSILSTDELDPSIPRIDRITPTTRPRTLRVGRFTAVDDYADWSILRTGMRNRILTQRDGEKHTWLTMDTYFDTFFEDPEYSRTFSNLYNDVYWNPVPWLNVEVETQLPLFSTSNFTEVASSLRFMPDEDLEIQLQYRHLNTHPILRDSNLITIETFARLNEYWGIGTYHRYEAATNFLEIQQYNLHHDFESYVGSIGLYQRNNSAENEMGVMFSFGLKEMPNLSLPFKFGAEY
jgi:LPS-assembly protein